MKKILLPLFLISASMVTIKIGAYCAYNHSNDEPITIKVFSIKKDKKLFPRATYRLQPKGDKVCRNWKSIDKNNRKKEWFWRAYNGDKRTINIWTDRIGEGYFPIGGAILFMGYDEDARAKFDIYYDGKPWEYEKSPWNHRSRPWKTNKR